MRVCPVPVGAGKRYFPGGYGWISSWSRSNGSVTGRSFCGMMSAADRSKRTECFTSFFRLRGHAGLGRETIRKMLMMTPVLSGYA